MLARHWAKCEQRVHAPCRCSVAITDVIGSVEINFFHRWSDFIFVVSAVLTIVAFVITRKSRTTMESDTMMLYGSNGGAGVSVAVNPEPRKHVNSSNYDRFKMYFAPAPHGYPVKGYKDV